MNPKKTILILVCLLAGAGVSSAQNTDAVNRQEQLQQQIDRLQKLLELEQQAQQLQQQAGQQPQGAPPATRQQYPQGSPQQPQQPRQGMPRSSGGPVTLKPIDTGRSVVTFNLGDKGGKSVKVSKGGGYSGTPGRYLVKTNLLYAGAAQSPNLSFEMGLGPRTSVEATIGFNSRRNLWDNAVMEAVDGTEIMHSYKRRLNHVFGKAEFRYWLRERFRGHFFGAGVLFADYKVGRLDMPLLFEKEYQYDGTAYGGSLTYGYLWRWNSRWAMEFSLSGGVVVMPYDKSQIKLNTDSYDLINKLRFKKTYFGPTGVGIKLVFTIH